MSKLRNKSCIKCGVALGRVHFAVKYCSNCVKIARRETALRYYYRNVETSNKRNKEYIKSHPEYYKKRYRKRLQKEGYREKINRYARERNRRYRLRALMGYGGKCACCGETQLEFLTIDHKNNDGNKHRKEIKNANIYAWAIRNNYPPVLQILCHNCHGAKSFYGECPHNRKK